PPNKAEARKNVRLGCGPDPELIRINKTGRKEEGHGEAAAPPHPQRLSQLHLYVRIAILVPRCGVFGLEIFITYELEHFGPSSHKTPPQGRNQRGWMAKVKIKSVVPLSVP
ncbi:regulator of sigma E protease, partial [Trypanosoma cruzi]